MKKFVFASICLISVSSPLFALNVIAELLTGAVLMGKTSTSKEVRQDPRDAEYEAWFKAANEIRKKDTTAPSSRLMRFRWLANKEPNAQLNLIWQCNEKNKWQQCRDEAYEYLIDKKYFRCMDPSFFSSKLDTKEKIVEKANGCVPKAIEYADDEIKEYEKLIESRSKGQQ